MRLRRMRFTIGRLMGLVALLGVSSALIRVHPSLAALAAGISSMAFIRTCEKIDRSRAAGRPMGSMQVVETWSDSVVVAFTILGAALLPGLGIMPIFSPSLPPGPGLDEPAIMGIAVTVLLGIPIAAYLRRRMW
jgi:hypothetical protein